MARARSSARWSRVAGYTARWYVGQPLSWLADRMGWSDEQSRTELERLCRDGLVSTNGDQELLAKREAVELALAASPHPVDFS